MCIDALPACIPVYQVSAWHPQSLSQGVRSPGAGVTAGCEPPCGCWERESSARKINALNC